MPIDINRGHYDPKRIYRSEDLQGLDSSQGWVDKSIGAKIVTEHSGFGVCKYQYTYKTYEKTIHHKNISWKVARGIAIFAATFFTLGLAYIFSKNVRDLWQVFRTGDEIRRIKVVTPDMSDYSRVQVLTEPIIISQTKPKTDTEVVLPLSSDEQIFKDFYTSGGKDFGGRTLRQIQEFTLDEKEGVHNYIQWLFPLKEFSKYNRNVILLTDSLILALKNDPLTKANMETSLGQMLIFYGLEWKEGTIQPNAFFGKGGDKDRSMVWLTPDNHNHLRLSRMLESLHLLGMSRESSALFECLKKIYEQFPFRITPVTWKVWNKKHSLGTR